MKYVFIALLFIQSAHGANLEKSMKELVFGQSGFEKKLHKGDCEKDRLTNEPYKFDSTSMPQAFEMKLKNGKTIKMITVGLIGPDSNDDFLYGSRYLTINGNQLSDSCAFFKRKELKKENSGLKFFNVSCDLANEKLVGEVASIQPIENSVFTNQGITRLSFCKALENIWPKSSWPHIGFDGDTISTDRKSIPRKIKSEKMQKLDDPQEIKTID